MLFLKPAASKNRFIAGLFAASDTTPGASYFPLKNNGQPTTLRAGISFPGNDWITFPEVKSICHGWETLRRSCWPT